MSTAFGDTQHTGLGTNGFEVSLNYITGIPDPNLLLCSNTLKLAFKSLLKRDPNTKEKSITTMLDYVKKNPTELDDDLTIITWVQMYPKLSIDDSKKVRSLAHQIQSQFVFSLGKSYAKYLKDTIGVWLSGMFDQDRSTAKACKESIDFAFGSKKEKISNLWKIFTVQILQYCYQVLAYETKDTLSDERFATKEESQAKYLRVLQGSILLIVHVLGAIDSIDLNEETIGLLTSITSQEVYLEAFSSKDFSLKRAAYMLFKSLVVSKHVDAIINKHSYKVLSKAMVKGMKLNSEVNVLLYSTVIINIMDTLVCVTSYNPLFWTSIKKADEKLLSLLRVGSLNSEPIYYDIVYKLLKVLPPELFSFDNPKTIEPYYAALLQSVEKEKSIQFSEKGWKIIINLTQSLVAEETLTDKILDNFTLSLIKLLDSPKVLSQIFDGLLHGVHGFANDNKDVLLDINSVIMDALPNKPIVFADFSGYTVNHTNSFVESFINLLDSNKSDLEEILLANSLEAANESSISDEAPILSFTIIDIFIKKNSIQFSESITSFMKTIPSVISERFVDQPLETLTLYSHSSFADEAFVNSLINQTFISLQKLNLANKLLKIVSKFGHFDIHETTELNAFLVQNSKTFSKSGTAESSAGSDDHSSLYEFLTLEILVNLYENEEFSSFISNCFKHYNNKLFLEFVEEKPEFLERLFLTIITNEPCDVSDYSNASGILDKLEENLLSDNIFTTSYEKSLLSAVGKSNFDFTSLESRISKLPDEIISNLLQKSFADEFEKVFEYTRSNFLSLSNSFDLSSYLFVDEFEDKKEMELADARFFINKACFYCQLLRKHNSGCDSILKNIVDLSLISEFSSDFLFLNPSLPGKVEENIIEFQKVLNYMFLDLFEGLSYDVIIQNLMSNENKHKQLTYLISILDKGSQSKRYYSHKLLQRLLMEKVQHLSKTSFANINIKPLVTHPGRLFAMINSSRSYLASSNLEHVRTNTVANLISIKKSSEICTFGLQQLLLLNAFINVDLDSEIPENFVMISPQRCLILLNTLFNWLDSEIAYEDGFRPVRLAIMQFVQRYIDGIYYVCDSSYPSDFISKIFEVGVRLLSETVNLVNSDEVVSIDLLGWSLKLYILLSKYKEEIEIWDDECSDVETEIIELFFKFSTVSRINQPVKIIGEQYSHILKELIDSKTLGRYYARLYDLIKSENIQIQRLACSLLHGLIPEVQDNLVVEFALSKKKADETGNSNIHLPQALLSVSDSPLTDYIEFEEPWKVYQYLWSWYLIMDHFKNITQQMRQDYITDLGEEKIRLLLNFIFSDLEISKFKIHDDDKNYVKDYSFNDYRNLNYSEEIEKILVNLIYEIMNNIGGTFAQNWFRSIKDKQFQQNVERFVSRFISPQLINEILSTLSDKNSLEDGEFKIVINRKTNEIKCLYNIDEQKMEISISLPSNFPLSQITVNGVSRVGVDEKKWKSWIMSAQYVINFQNGTILDSIKHFKDNATANFENYDDCAICYSILNAVDHSTPNKVCPTCKHNFHSACLYRWFKSSGSSTCPLCRSKFQFKKHS